MEKSLLTEVKAILKSLVLSCPEKITVEKLNRDYRDVEGQFIPFRQLGYANLELFLHSIPDTLRVFGSGPTAMVCFVANEKSDHIHDMIMKQKKSKSRSTPKRSGHYRGYSSQKNNNRVNNVPPQPVRKMGQQLSPYESVNRDCMKKKPQVKALPSVINTTPHCVPSVPNYQMLYTFPQPNGIVLNPLQSNLVLSSIKKGLITPNYQTQNIDRQVSQVCNLLKTQCGLSNPPPPLPSQENRTVKFCNKARSPEQVKDESSKKIVNEKSTEINAAKNSSATAKATSPEKEISIKLSDEVDNSMPKLKRVLNPFVKSVINELKEEKTNSENIESVNEKVIQPKSKRFFDDSSEITPDPDEAVPTFAAKNNVFRLDFPEYTVSYGSKIVPYELSDDINIESYIKIFVSEIHNPFKFWFHIYKDHHELDSLMHQMERYYSTLNADDMRIPLACLTPGQVCAACYRGLWHRAEIVAPPVNFTIKVSFIDYGTVSEVNTDNIKFLGSYFAQLPAQALRGSLSHIKPRGFHWSHDATMHFLSLVSDLLLYAKITEIDREKNILYMILCDTNGDEVVQINTSMVKNRYACPDIEWKTERIIQNQGKRIHHPREDFPTFSMIESGEYPSFPELVSLKQRGIDYEAIYDRIIHNPSIILNKHEKTSESLRNLPYFLTTSNPFRTDILLELTKAI